MTRFQAVRSGAEISISIADLLEQAAPALYNGANRVQTIREVKEVRQHKETIFFGLSVRQFVCAVLAVGIAVGVYFLLKTITGPETASWACIVAAAPVAVTGFFQYNCMTFEQFVWAYLKSQFLCAGPRVFQSENICCAALAKKGVHDYD